MREQASNHGKTLLRKVWGIRKGAGGLELPEQAAQDNPLLAVLWARFQESCRLFHASGAPLSSDCLLCFLDLSSGRPLPTQMCKSMTTAAITWLVH